MCYTTDKKVTELFLEIIVDSQYSSKKRKKKRNTAGFLVYFAQFPAMITFCKTTIQCHKQDTDNDTIYQPYSVLSKAFLTSQYTFAFILSILLNALYKNSSIVFTSLNWFSLTI